MYMSKRTGVLAFVLGALASATPGMAQNLLVNPGFTSNLDGWDPFTGFGILQEWSALDSAGDPSSGSLYGTLPASSTFRVPIYASQCVAVVPDSTYRFGGKVLLPSASTPGSAYGTVFVNSYASANCAGNYVVNAVAPVVVDRDVWTSTSGTLVAGFDIASIRVHLRVYAPMDTALQSYFDDIFLEPYEIIFANGFD